MQASVSGFFVHVTHDVTDGTDLRLEDAQKFLSELEGAVGNVEQAIFEKVQADAATVASSTAAEDAAAADVAAAVAAEPTPVVAPPPVVTSTVDVTAPADTPPPVTDGGSDTAA